MWKRTLILLSCLCGSAWGQDGEYAPGLIGRYRDNARTITRLDRRLAFHWSSFPDRRLDGERFNIQWRGRLLAQASGNYRFYIYAQGKFQLKVGDKQVLQGNSKKARWFDSRPVALEFDFHPLQVSFENTARGGRIALFWSGPKFQLEPISERHLLHDPDQNKPPSRAFHRGEQLVRSRRCAACHQVNGEAHITPAPAMDHFAATVKPTWLIKRLTQTRPSPGQKMPTFGLAQDDAESIVAFLKARSRPPAKHVEPTEKRAAKKIPAKERIKVANGKRLFTVVGCLACHQVGQLGRSGPFGGGNLSAIGTKRPTHFFTHWLANPKQLNRDHRMPVFRLTSIERQQLAKYLSSLRAGGKENGPTSKTSQGRVERGRQLFQRHGCQNCHPLNNTKEKKMPPLAAGRIDGKSNWQKSCLSAPTKGRPGYALALAERRAAQEFVSQVKSPPATGERVLHESNCLSCHNRDQIKGLSAQLTAIRRAHPQLASVLPALSPPALTGVGDKLLDSALRDAVRAKEPRRPWLMVRMPRFNLTVEQEAALIEHLIARDRVPNRPQKPTGKQPSSRILKLAGRRLVTTSGFGCTSCHRVGSVLPPKAPLNALGPNLSMLGKRIRRSWYDRWVRNPVRMVPRMEMPSIQVGVRGVLNGQLDHQLSGVWEILNEPGFEPPLPSPVRIVRRSGIGTRAVVLTDVLNDRGRQLIKPVLVGLPNRHNILFDLTKPGLASWWIGDVAHQRTRGKTWFWVSAGVDVMRNSKPRADIQVRVGRKWLSARRQGQFPTELDAIVHVPGGVRLEYRLRNGPHTLRVEQTLLSRDSSPFSFWRRIRIRCDQPIHARILVLHSEHAGRVIGRKRVEFQGDDQHQVWCADDVTKDPAGVWQTSQKPKREHRFEMRYVTKLPVDGFLSGKTPAVKLRPLKLNAVPGFSATRLPIADSLMPTGLDWRSDGTLFITSLKGRVWRATDTDGDGLEDRLQPFGDELAAPFGIAAYDKYVDVINKYALLRLHDANGDGFCERTERIASGWGHTADYHDWTVGLPRDKDGNYFLAISCQQDDRSLAAAKWRGTVVKLTPNRNGRFDVQPWTAGHRFPIGLAMKRSGELFVTDNQGNWNPFNELNHVIRGKHFGFINKVERKPGYKPPPLTPPTIAIPHPWTRSVNGICFLETPLPVLKKRGARFGAFEGQLVGCEYDTRRIIRMSLEKVKGEYQGATYPFSYDQPPRGQPLLGPLVCAVSPQGDLYVGCIRDSGWGGANNIGTMVKLSLNRLPPGIAEVTATPNGLRIRFTQLVDNTKAKSVANYAISSYRRISTPRYGGSDRDRRVEKVRRVTVSKDGRVATLSLGKLRRGYVYELRVRNIALNSKATFFPAEAYYTMRNIP